MRRVLFVLFVVLAVARGWAAPAPPPVKAPAGLLMDARTGQVLWERDADTPRPIASTTKMMTALLAVESGRLDETVTVSKAASQVEESSLHLKPGERLTLRDLVYGVMMRSANDASVAVAEHMDGGVEPFVARMNQRAAELGCAHTHFLNPHGLHHPDHQSTPRDLALMARAALELPAFRHLARTRKYTIQRSVNRADTLLRARDHWFLSRYPGANGVKTGRTQQAGHCFVASATRGDTTLISVLLHSPNIRQETVSCLDWGFKNFRTVRAVAPDTRLGTIPVAGGSAWEAPVLASAPVWVTLPAGGAPVAVRLEGLSVKAPVEAGQRVGTAPVLANGQTVGQVDVVAGARVGISSRRAAGRTAGAAFLVGTGCILGTAAKNTGRRRRRVPARGGRSDPGGPRARQRARRHHR